MSLIIYLPSTLEGFSFPKVCFFLTLDKRILNFIIKFTGGHYMTACVLCLSWPTSPPGMPMQVICSKSFMRPFSTQGRRKALSSEQHGKHHHFLVCCYMPYSNRMTTGNILHLLPIFTSLYIEIYGEFAQIPSHCVAPAHTAQELVCMACAPFLRAICYGIELC